MQKHIRPSKESYILSFEDAEFCFRKDGRMIVISSKNQNMFCFSDQETTLLFQELSKFENYKRAVSFLKEQTLNGSKATKEDITFLMFECEKAWNECIAEKVQWECESEGECDCECY